MNYPFTIHSPYQISNIMYCGYRVVIHLQCDQYDFNKFTVLYSINSFSYPTAIISESNDEDLCAAILDKLNQFILELKTNESN